MPVPPVTRIASRSPRAAEPLQERPHPVGLVRHDLPRDHPMTRRLGQLDDQCPRGVGLPRPRVRDSQDRQAQRLPTPRRGARSRLDSSLTPFGFCRMPWISQFAKCGTHQTDDCRRIRAHLQWDEPEVRRALPHPSARVCDGGPDAWPSLASPRGPDSSSCCLASEASVLGAGEGRADRIILRGGGQIRGKVLPDPDRPDRVIVLTETGKTPLTFQKPQIVRVVAEPERPGRLRGPVRQGGDDRRGAVRARPLVRAAQAVRPGRTPL